MRTNWAAVAADDANLPPRQRDVTVNQRAAALRHYIMHLGRTTSHRNETPSGSFNWGVDGIKAISAVARRPYSFYMICSVKVISIWLCRVYPLGCQLGKLTASPMRTRTTTLRSATKLQTLNTATGLESFQACPWHSSQAVAVNTERLRLLPRWATVLGTNISSSATGLNSPHRCFHTILWIYSQNTNTGERGKVHWLDLDPVKMLFFKNCTDCMKIGGEVGRKYAVYLDY